MSTETAGSMTPEEIEAYRASVKDLIERCLEWIRQYPVPRDADPVPERSRP
jgi:hypothetical protein